jgi:hypothetical protein
MDERFASWRRRYPQVDDDPSLAWGSEALRLVRLRAARLEEDVCRAAAIRPDEVRRLRWTARAIRTAAVRRAAP